MPRKNEKGVAGWLALGLSSGSGNPGGVEGGESSFDLVVKSTEHLSSGLIQH
jgi:hypothetical protein